MVFLVLALGSAAHAAETAANGADDKTLADGAGVVAVPSAPRPAQIEPIVVPPVKREMPKTPELKAEPASKETKARSAAPAKSAKGKAAEKVVGDKPNCDAGYKVDASGKSCVRIAESENRAKKKGR